jgi:N-sulfoglucosamine sulfohydrolase
MFRFVGLLVAGLLAAGLAASSALAADRPNVLFITLDDMNWDSVGVFGSEVPDTTPNIDRLASQGLRFEHGHVTIAICRPTRAVWMTGRYPHNSGAAEFNQIYGTVPTLPETLKANGYTTGILGKTEHVIPSRKKAFDYKRDGDEMIDGRSADLYAEFSEEFFDRAKRSGKPFFFMVNLSDPHRPFDNRKPAEKRRIEASSGERRKRNRGDHPVPSKIYRNEEITMPGFLPDLPPIRTEIAQYYSSVRRADDVVGAVLKILAESGFAENTLVMLKSDHGMAMPFAKTNVWRNSTRRPWIVRWPSVVEPGTHDTEHLVGGVDFAPTILEAVGLEPMEGMDGRSFLPLLKGQEQGGWDHVYTYIYTTARRTPYTMRSVQDVRYGYIWNDWSNGKRMFVNEGQEGLTMNAMLQAAENDENIAARVKHFLYRVPEEFYDYEKDPDALHNLIDDPAMQGKIEALRARLIEHMKRTRDRKRWRLEKVGASRLGAPRDAAPSASALR